MLGTARPAESSADFKTPGSTAVRPSPSQLKTLRATLRSANEWIVSGDTVKAGCVERTREATVVVGNAERTG